MAKAAAISLSKFSTVVQEAVKVAIEKHPKLKVDPQSPFTAGYLIWGIPVPELLASAATLRESQAFADDLASGLGAGFPGDAAVKLRGAVFSHGGHLILGFPVPPEVLLQR
jgi:hypothetical protein